MSIDTKEISRSCRRSIFGNSSYQYHNYHLENESSEFQEEGSDDFDMLQVQLSWPHTCCFCGKKYKDLEKFDEHVMSHAMKSSISFKCSHMGCNRKFPIPQEALKLKSRTRTRVNRKSTSRRRASGSIEGIESRDFWCEKCPSTLMSRKSYNRHKSTVHCRNKSFRCSECGNSFKRNDYLTKHLRTVHLKLKPYICSDCGQAFGYQSHLKRHSRNTHDMEDNIIE